MQKDNVENEDDNDSGSRASDYLPIKLQVNVLFEKMKDVNDGSGGYDELGNELLLAKF